jgi:hypothetical protein
MGEKECKYSNNKVEEMGLSKTDLWSPEFKTMLIMRIRFDKSLITKPTRRLKILINETKSAHISKICMVAGT